MTKKLGCLHAHYSNIDYIEKAISLYEIDCVHFVDPALMYRVSEDSYFTEADAKSKVIQQIEWISQSNVDAILITCTNYIALLEEERLSVSVPIIKIDEPFFESITAVNGPQTIVFSNPATINGTMQRLQQYAANHNRTIDIKVVTVPNSFELIMQGLKRQYDTKISQFLHTIINDQTIAVAQLSMVDACKEFEKSTCKQIINPLDPLTASIFNQLGIKKKDDLL